MPFLDRITFRPELYQHVGVEREFFLRDRQSRHLVPRARDFLTALSVRPGLDSWGEELSACQVEHKTQPHGSMPGLEAELKIAPERVALLIDSLGLSLVAEEVAPEDMPLDVYPNERYLQIVQRLPPQVLSAACRVTGTHVHLGMRDIDEAIVCYNRLVRALPELATMGDHSCGERLRLYRVVAPNCQPPILETAEHLEVLASAHGFADNPRNCWWLVRITRYGTVEVRVFGMTADSRQTMSYVRRSFEIAFGYLPPE